MSSRVTVITRSHKKKPRNDFSIVSLYTYMINIIFKKILAVADSTYLTNLSHKVDYIKFKFSKVNNRLIVYLISMAS